MKVIFSLFSNALPVDYWKLMGQRYISVNYLNVNVVLGNWWKFSTHSVVAKCSFKKPFFLSVFSLPPTPSGWNKRVDYEPGTGSKQLFPKMHLETCDGPLSSVRVMVELQTSHIGKGCDRETYSEKSLQRLCGECQHWQKKNGCRCRPSKLPNYTK